MTKQAKPRDMMKCDYSVIRDCQLKLDLTDSLMSKALGFSDSAIFGWRKEGKAPFVAGLAAEALVRRQGQGYNPNVNTIWMLRLTGE